MFEVERILSRASSHVVIAALAVLAAAGGCFNSSKSSEDAGPDPDTIEQDHSEDFARPDEDAAGDPVQDPDPDAPDAEDPAIEDPAVEDWVDDLEDRDEDTADDVPGEDAGDDFDAVDAADLEGIEEIEDMLDGEIFDPYPAPNFTLVDANPDSSTYHEIRTLSGARGKVIVLYFVGFS